MPATSSPFAGFKSLGADLTATYSTEFHEVGTVQMDQFGNHYMFVFADTEAITANAIVTISAAGVVTLANGAGDRVDGFAPTAIALDNYGWVLIKGDAASVPVATGVAINEYLQYLANASAQMAEIVAVDEGGATSHAAGAHAVRAVTLTAPSANAATVRFF